MSQLSDIALLKQTGNESCVQFIKLILQELRLIRSEMKEEVRKLAWDLKSCVILSNDTSNKQDSNLGKSKILNADNDSKINIGRGVSECSATPTDDEANLLDVVISVNEREEFDEVSMNMPAFVSTKCDVDSAGSTDEFSEKLNIVAAVVKQEVLEEEFVTNTAKVKTNVTDIGHSDLMPHNCSALRHILNPTNNQNCGNLTVDLPDSSATDSSTISGCVYPVHHPHKSKQSEKHFQSLNGVKNEVWVGLPSSQYVKPKKRFWCSICGKNFFKSNDLTRHIRVHTGERPYKCDVCFKRFSRKYILKCHLRTHR